MRQTLLAGVTRRTWRRNPTICWACSSRVQARNSSTAKLDPNERFYPPTAKKPYYVTTPIFYVNAAPHVGHLYTMVFADVVKRWQTLRGRKALLCTGTDEHGMKIQQAAEKAGSRPRFFCDQGATIFRSLADHANVSYDYFVRTSDPKHKDAVQYAWQILQQKGLIYASKHEGWYSISDETFYPQSAVHLIIDPATGRKHMASIDTGKEVEWTEEVNYHFRLSQFRERLLDFYANNPTWIKPRARYDDVTKAVTEGLEDLSISRPSSRLTWGVPVPGDSTQTIYVWLDALLNYATAAGYPWSPEEAYARGWPADCQVVGKDIIRFHCIYWPAILMALDMPLPGCIVTHAHWTIGKQKMAKSTGNVVNPFLALDRFGTDVMRYYLMHDGRLSDDSDYSNHAIGERYRIGLQQALGNLLSRVTRAKRWNVRAAVVSASKKDWEPSTEEDVVMWKRLYYVSHEVSLEMERFRVAAGLRSVMELIYKTNQYMQHAEPWKLRSVDQQSRLETIIYIAAEALRISGILLQPYMPTKAHQLLDILGVEAHKRRLHDARPGMDVGYGGSGVVDRDGVVGTLFPPLIADV
ncbi:hypothetical protein EJ06DRAFT_526105 [Trichodelitschia bisporula]|uniref:Probable methionine--tRNA ligase, mitochondrial n=1 Tax=Trichodelitschia bisporula TaxID=703511 RepID=A0A6G1IBM1_9PEZI|nr:hypothetical protein EJ06DRAFT_526105 [Trichodelitschia bisporula]